MLSTRAVIQRINRKLSHDLEAVRKTRLGSRAEQEIGQYYRLDLNRNFIIDGHLDLDAYGRDLGVIAPWEEVVEDDA